MAAIQMLGTVVQEQTSCATIKKGPRGTDMNFLAQISFDEIVGSLLVCLVMRELMILALPDHVAGPGGWLIDTGSEEA